MQQIFPANFSEWFYKFAGISPQIAAAVDITNDCITEFVDLLR